MTSQRTGSQSTVALGFLLLVFQLASMLPLRKGKFDSVQLMGGQTFDMEKGKQKDASNLSQRLGIQHRESV